MFQASGPEVHQAIASLQRQGLVYLNASTSIPTCELTVEGRLLAQDLSTNSSFTETYLNDTLRMVPEISGEAVAYLREAFRCYESMLYLAATVMAGVATEACCKELLATAIASDQINPTKKQRAAMEGEMASMYAAMEALRNCMDEAMGPSFKAIKFNLGVQLFAAVSSIREARNAVGHPTGAAPTRDDVFVHLRIFPSIAQKIYELRRFLENGSAT